jgi:hypothetical protein
VTTLCETYQSQAAARDATEALSASHGPHHDIRLLIGHRWHNIRHQPVVGSGGPVDPTLRSGHSPVLRGRAGKAREAFTAIQIANARGPSPTSSGSTS